MNISFPAFGYTVYVEIYRKRKPDAGPAEAAETAKAETTEAHPPKPKRPITAFFRRIRQHFTTH